MFFINTIAATRRVQFKSIVEHTKEPTIVGFQGVTATMQVQSGSPAVQPCVELGTQDDVDVALCEDAPYAIPAPWWSKQEPTWK